MRDVRSLIRDQLRAVRLDVLVFGPALDPPSGDPYIAALQIKRQEIRDRLIAEGHSARFGEEVVDPSLPPLLADPLLQEVAVMREADFIVVLVGSPGTLIEGKAITHDPSLRSKAAFYCFDEHKDGIAVKHFIWAGEHAGSTCQLTTLPDVQACHLTTAVLEKIQTVQLARAFL